MKNLIRCLAITVAVGLSFMFGYTEGFRAAETSGTITLLYIKEQGDFDYKAGRYDVASAAYEKFYQGATISRNASFLPHRFPLEAEELMVLLYWTRCLQLTSQNEKASAVLQDLATRFKKELGGDVRSIQRVVDQLEAGEPAPSKP